MVRGVKIIKLLIIIVTTLLINRLYAQQITSLSIEESGNLYSKDSLKAQSATSPSDGVKLIYDWKVDPDGAGASAESSIKVFHMTFDGDNIYDYINKVSGAKASGSTASYDNTGGYDGRGSYTFVGGNGLRIENSNLTNITGKEITLAAWIYPTAFDYNWGRIVSKSTDDLSADPYTRYGFITKAAGLNKVSFRISTTDNVAKGIGSDELELNKWSFIVGSYNDGEMRFYVNGDLVRVKYVDGGNIGLSNAPLRIGYVGNASYNQDFKGKIDDVMIFNRALSGEQVSAMFNNSLDPEGNYTGGFREDIIVPQETKAGEIWKLTATPNDNSSDGISVNSSNEVTIQPPLISGVQLDYLTDGGIKKNALEAKVSGKLPADLNIVYDWKLGGNSIKTLEMPFNDGDFVKKDSVRDYVGDFDGKINNLDYNPNGGYDGNGCMVFNDSLTATDANADDYITIPKEVGAVFGGDFTWAIWFNHHNEHDAGTPFAVENNLYSDVGTMIRAGVISLRPDRTIRLTVRGVSDTGTKTASSNILYQSGVWNHIAVTKNGNNFRVYYNGDLLPEMDLTASGSTAISGEDLVLGKHIWRGADNDPIYGKLDDFVIYNRALSPDQIQLLYNRKANLLHQSETKINENWSVTAIPNDNFTDGVSKPSNNISVALQPVDKVAINSANSNLFPGDTLRADVLGFIPSDAKTIYDWKLDPDGAGPLTSSSIKLLDIPFDCGKICSSMPCEYIHDLTLGYPIAGDSPTYLSDGGVKGSGTFNFNGTSNAFAVPHHTSMDEVNDFSISVWIKLPNAFSSTAFIINKRENNEGIRLKVDGGSEVKLEINTTTNGHNTKTSGAGINDGEWHFITAVRKGTFIGVYIDGILNESKSDAPLGNVSDNNVSLNIGCEKVGTGNPFTGTIDEIIVWNTALPVEQIQAMYNGGEEFYRTDIIVPEMTDSGQTWGVSATANDNNVKGEKVDVDEDTSIDMPEVDRVDINSGIGFALNSDSLVANPVNPKPSDLRMVNDWKFSTDDGSTYSSIKVLELPMDISAKNYIDNSEATVYGATHKNHGGLINGNYTFDGVDDYIDLGAGTNYFNVGVTTRTISMWIKAKEINKVQSLLDWHSYPLAYGLGIGFYIFSDNKIRCESGNGGSGTGSSVSTVAIQKDVWHHIAFTMDGSVGKTYLDGVEVHDATACARVYQNPGGNLWLGRAHSAFRHYGAIPSNFDGEMDEVQIYDRVLTHEQIKALAGKKQNIIVSEETNLDEKWKVISTPNDGYAELSAFNSEVAKISIPVISEVELLVSSTDTLPLDTLSSQITGLLSSDFELYYNWELNNKSIKPLHLNFNRGYTASNNLFTSDVFERHTANINGATYMENGGESGSGALSFDGIDDYLVVPASTELNNFNEITVSARLNIYESDGIYAIASQRNECNTGPLNWQFYIHQNKLMLALDTLDKDLSTYKLFYSDSEVPTNGYHNFAVTYDGETINFYIDGENVGTAKTSTNFLHQNSLPTYIGNESCATWFKGLMDDLRIYNKALSPEQMKQLSSNAGIVLPEELEPGDKWQVCAIPADNFSYGSSVCSGEITVNPPKISSVEIEVSSTDSLIAKITELLPSNSKVHYDWKVDGSSIKVYDEYMDGGKGFLKGTPGVNLCVNGEFETNLSGWEQITPDGTFDGSISIDKVLSGAGALKFTNPEASTAIRQNITVVPNEIYVISGWIYKSGLANVYLDIEDINEEVEAISTKQGQWEYVEARFRAGNSTTSVNFRVVIDNIPGSGTFWVDKLRFYKESQSPKYLNSAGFDGYGCYSFDGVDDFLEIPDHSDIDLTNDFTISAWINPAQEHSGASAAGVVLRKDDAYEIYYHEKKANMRIYIGGSTLGIPIDQELNPNQWYYVVMTYKNGQLKGYIDGEFISSHEYSGNVDVNDNSLAIGRYATPSFPFNGMIDDISIFKRALTDKQIKAMYNGGALTYSENIIVPDETIIGEKWSVCATPYENYYGLTVCNDIPIEITANMQRRIIIVITDL